MKIRIALLFVLSAATAQAQLFVPIGTKGTLKVEYLYTAAGKSGTENDGNIQEWKVRRVINITANYVAEAPQVIGTLHKMDARQQAALDKQRTDVQAFAKKMEPTMNDMMAIAERCGESEACIEKEISEYGNKMDKSQIQADKKTVADLTRPGETRYQRWRSTSMNGTYSIDETTSLQVFEMTCTRTKVCKRTVTTKGGGALPQPGNGSVEGLAMMEVDSVAKDMALMLPGTLLPLKVDTVVQTSIMDDDTKGGPGFAKPMYKNQETLVIAIPGDSVTNSGTRTFKGTGHYAESGTLTVTWSFTRN